MAKELGHFTKEDRGLDRKDMKKVFMIISHHYSERHSRSLEGLESNTLRAPKTGKTVEQLQLLLVGGDVTLREHFGELLAVAHEDLSREMKTHVPRKTPPE